MTTTSARFSSAPHGTLLEEGWSRDCPTWKVRPVFCVSHSRAASLPRRTARGGKAGPPSPGQTLTSADEERTQEGMGVMVGRPRITNPNWEEELITSSFGSGSWPPSLAAFCKAVAWVLLPTISQQDGGKLASEGNKRERMECWSGLELRTSRSSLLSPWSPSEGPPYTWQNQMNPKMPAGASSPTHSPLHPLLVCSWPPSCRISLPCGSPQRPITVWSDPAAPAPLPFSSSPAPR